MKILVLGHAGHGKDTVSELFDKYSSLSYIPTTNLAMEEIIWPNWGHQHYASISDCQSDKNNHRPKLYQVIREYNTPDLTRFAKFVLGKCDIYCGMRHIDEFMGCEEISLFDLIIWVDASKRKPPEAGSSFTIPKSVAHFVINNNGTKDQLDTTIRDICAIIGSNS